MILERKFLTLLNRISKPFKMKLERSYTKRNFESIHLQHLVSLPDREELLKRLPQKGIVAEIGVNEGDFSEKILSICQPHKLILVDIWASKRYHSGLFEKVQNRFAIPVQENRIDIVRKLSLEAIVSFPDQYFDWVYLDTDHSLETTLNELALLRPKMKPDGIIAGHDYIPGNWNSGYRYGVIEAVREFCLEYHWEMIYLTHELDDHPSFAIKRIINT